MTHELADFVTKQVSAGNFASVSEVYREALRRFREQEEEKKLHLRLLELELEKGIADSKAGRVIKIDSAEDHEDFYTEIQQQVSNKASHA